MCTASTALDCDDGDPCTADGCDGLSGCFNDPIELCVAPAPVPATGALGQLLIALGFLLGAGHLAWRARAVR